ncbi:MAG: Hpt domain-containing protein, partial [Campylobacter sp.]|uniref:Hpt domain-containing protein n=1 Tax=Campylobacter sp. TaxID=205 RepID=UPI001B58AF9F
MDDMQEILEDFLVEAFELIEQIDHDLVELEANPEDLELLNRIFRVAHTVKGSSSFLNFDVLTKLTHHMEDVLNKARHGELKITPDIMDVVLESVDMMKALLRSIRERGNDTDAGVSITDICHRLTAINEGRDPNADENRQAQPQEETQSKPQEDSQPEPQSAMDQEPEVDVNSLSEAEVEAEIERLLKVRKAEDQARRDKQKQNSEQSAVQTPESTPAPAPTPAAKPAPKKESKESNTPAHSSASAVEQTIRVEVKRLDNLMNLIGELVLGKNRLLKIYDDVEE